MKAFCIAFLTLSLAVLVTSSWTPPVNPDFAAGTCPIRRAANGGLLGRVRDGFVGILSGNRGGIRGGGVATGDTVAQAQAQAGAEVTGNGLSNTYAAAKAQALVRDGAGIASADASAIASSETGTCRK